MNARAVAEEVASWYSSKLDPFCPHSQNVRRFLQGPVVSLTHGILTGQDEMQASTYDVNKEEKKGDVEELDKSLWGLPHDSKAVDDLYLSLSKRQRDRLDAFIIGIEIAMPSEETEPPKLKMKAPRGLFQKTPNSSIGSVPESKPVPSVEGLFTPPNSHKKSPKRSSIESPVLTSLNNHGKALLRSVSVESFSRMKQPQMETKELKIRLELYLRSIHRVKTLQRDCVISAEPDRAIKARAEMITAALVSNVGCVRSMKPSLTKLLANMTRELLGVEYVGEDLFRVIRKIVNEYEHGTSFASLAFLSSPEASAETTLTPMVVKYIRYLQSDWKTHERNCELERMLACSLDPNMRRYLKTVEFRSIGHLLEVCQGFRHELNNIELTPTNSVSSGTGDLCNDSQAVKQAIRDLQREVITINGHALAPVTSRQDLISLLSSALNSRSLTATPLKKKLEEDQENAADSPSGDDSRPSIISTEITAKATDSSDADISVLDSPRADHKRKSRKQAAFHLATVDLLTRRLLIAASRTGTGGDAYFIVRDLFGDEDVEVVPAKVLPHHVRATRVGSIEIQVRLASVTIKCHGSFDIYPKSLVGCCEPLIQLHTTTSETIYLRELRPCDSASDDGWHEDDGSRSSCGMEKLVLEEKRTSKTGTRTLSIRPALYEKVQVWNTPS